MSLGGAEPGDYAWKIRFSIARKRGGLDDFRMYIHQVVLEFFSPTALEVAG